MKQISVIEILHGCYRVKEVFLHRLFNFINSLGSKYEFIPDLFHILNKYSLGVVLQMYIESGVFMSKFVWKKIIREKNRYILQDPITK